MADSLEVVSVEQDGRVLSGVGVDADRLTETMDRHTPDPEPAQETPPAEPAAAPKESRGRQRYSDLTKARDEAVARAAEIERERDELKAKLAAAPARSEPAAAPSSAPVPVARPAATRPKPTEDQVGTDGKYKSYADFIEDLNDWKDEQREATRQAAIDARIRESIAADRAAQSHSAKVDEALARGRKAYPDFDAMLKAPHMTATNWPGDKIQVLASLDAPEHVQYALAKDPALAESLRTEPNLAVFGMKLAQLMTAAPVAPLASTGPTSFVPPAPYQPVGSGSKTTVPPSSELAKRGFDFDKSGYREKRAAERGVIRKVK